jgi:hypothetical protein
MGWTSNTVIVELSLDIVGLKVGVYIQILYIKKIKCSYEGNGTIYWVILIQTVHPIYIPLKDKYFVVGYSKKILESLRLGRNVFFIVK